MNRQSPIAIGCALIAGICACCGCAPDSRIDNGKAVFRRPLERVSTLDPILSPSLYDAKTIALVYETLLKTDYEARPYKLAPALAEELPTVSSNGLVYTFKIRRNSRFSADPCFGTNADGSPKDRAVTAADVIYSLNRLADKSNASSGMWVMEGVKSIRAVDLHTVEITLKEPFYAFPWFMTLSYTGIVPKEAVEYYGRDFGQRAVGSGPWKLDLWQKSHKMRFVRKGDTPPDAYHAIEYYIIDDASTQWLMFLNGEIDMMGEVSRDNWDAVIKPDGTIDENLKKRGVRLLFMQGMEFYYLGFNLRDPVVGKNKKLRQALNCAFDFEAWRKFHNNRIERCTGPLPAGVEGYDPSPFEYSFNLEKAKRLLKEAGYENGINPKTGKRLVITLGLGRADQDTRESTELLAGFFNRIGVVLEPHYMTWNAFLDAAVKGKEQMYRIGWCADFPDAQNFLQLFYTPNFTPGPNRMCYSNPEFDDIFRKALFENDAAKRNDLWIKAQKIIKEDCPCIFLQVPRKHYLLQPTVGNFIPSAFPFGEETYFKVKTSSK